MSNLISAQPEYLRLNEAINQVYFGGRFSDCPAYLDPDGAIKPVLANALGEGEVDVDDCIIKNSSPKHM